jgi:small subunit ribosomal protein S1
MSSRDLTSTRQRAVRGTDRRIPKAADYDDPDALERRCADETFWAQVGAVIGERGAVLLEKGYLGNASRWHRLHSTDDLHAVRRRLAPRSRLLVWPDLSDDVDSVVAALPGTVLADVVWEDRDGQLRNHWVDQSVFDEISAVLAHARAAIALPGLADERHPLLTAVLPARTPCAGTP